MPGSRCSFSRIEIDFKSSNLGQKMLGPEKSENGAGIYFYLINLTIHSKIYDIRGMKMFLVICGFFCSCLVMTKSNAQDIEKEAWDISIQLHNEWIKG